MLPVIFVFFTALTLDDDGNGALASSPFSPYPLQPTYEYSHNGAAAVQAPSRESQLQL